MMAAAPGPAVPQLLVVDSSVAVKWFKSEDERAVEAALDILWGYQAGVSSIFVPGHFAAEVLNALRYSRLSLDQVAQAAAALEGFDLATIPLKLVLTERAVALARAYDLTINDALFPALAILLDAELVTADRAQARVTECRVRLLA